MGIGLRGRSALKRNQNARFAFEMDSNARYSQLQEIGSKTVDSMTLTLCCGSRRLLTGNSRGDDRVTVPPHLR